MPTRSEERFLRATLRGARRCAWQARARSDVVPFVKSDGTRCTGVDLAVERYIREAIRHTFPEDGIVGEELGAEGASRDSVWLVDPVDGTENLIRGLPGATTTLARHVLGATQLAGVCDLGSSKLWCASGEGAYVFVGIGRRRRLPIRAWAPEATSALAGFGLSARRRDLQLELVTATAGRFGDIRASGAAAADIIKVAEGRLDAHIELDLAPWDCVAALTIAGAAGAASYKICHPEAPGAGGVAVFAPNVRAAVEQTLNAAGCSFEPFTPTLGGVL